MLSCIRIVKMYNDNTVGYYEYGSNSNSNIHTSIIVIMHRSQAIHVYVSNMKHKK